jgi:4-amino-4-deoxy-L-arabinose transferase-like glycosyltransferase
MTSAIDKRRDRFRWLTEVADYAASSHARAVAVLVIAALLAFLPGFFQIPPMDRDEARFAQATKQMLETGEYVDIRFQGEVRYKKPVGIYWLQAAAVKTAEALGVPEARQRIWLYRIPSLLGAVGAVLATYWAALAFIPRRAALLAGLMMATSILLGGEARLAKTDAVLLLTCVITMGAMARAYLAERRGSTAGPVGWTLPAIFWTALAAGVLIKGPLILLFTGLAVVTLAIADRNLRWFLALRPLVGVLWFALLVLPWFVAILNRAGETFIAGSVGEDMLPKILGNKEGHGAPPGYYFLLFWVTFWPGAALAAMAVPSIWAARREQGARFLLAWIVPSWILFELVVTKLPHYVLPVYPAIAILIAGVVDSQMLAQQPWLRRGTTWWFMLPIILSVGAITLAVKFGQQLGFLAWPFAVASVIYGLWAWRLYQADGPERGLLRAMVASILLAMGIYAVIVPSLTAVFPSVALAQMMRNVSCKNPQVVSAGYHEPSLVFLNGTNTKLVDGTDAAEFLRHGGCRFALVEGRFERAFLRRAEMIGLRYAPAERFEGFNYSVGRAVSISIYRSEENP